METITIKVTDLSAVSDGYHTIQELYDHRVALFALLLLYLPNSWKSKKHADGSMYDGWFIAGAELNGKQITYHLPIEWWDRLPKVKELDKAPEWDGHTPQDVVDRIEEFVLTLQNLKKVYPRKFTIYVTYYSTSCGETVDQSCSFLVYYDGQPNGIKNDDDLVKWIIEQFNITKDADYDTYEVASQETEFIFVPTKGPVLSVKRLDYDCF